MERLESKHEFKSNKNKRVLISIPNRYWVHITVVRCLLLLGKDTRYQTKIIFPKHRPYENNLNHIIKQFVESNYDFWLSIDTDNPPLNNPLDLVEWDKDIIGCPTPIWHYIGNKKGERPVYWNAYDYDIKSDAYKEHQNKEGLQKVDAIGTGCFLMARRVFENEEMRKGAFMRQWHEDGTVHKGNDISFSEIARKNGFEIYCHFDYPCDHYSNLSLNEVVKAFRNMYERNN